MRTIHGEWATASQFLVKSSNFLIAHLNIYSLVLWLANFCLIHSYVRLTYFCCSVLCTVLSYYPFRKEGINSYYFTSRRLAATGHNSFPERGQQRQSLVFTNWVINGASSLKALMESRPLPCTVRNDNVYIPLVTR